MSGRKWEYGREFSIEQLRRDVRAVTIPILLAGPYPHKDEREREREEEFAERCARDYLAGAEWMGLDAGEAVAVWDEVAGEVLERCKRFRGALRVEERFKRYGEEVAAMGRAMGGR